MLRVALTGNVASGKSAVAEEWRRLGAPIIDADELAREVIQPGSPGHARVVERFGWSVLTADGAVDRARLRDIVFNDEARRQQLESILHPEIRRLRAEREAALAAAGAEIVVNVIPLLYEVGMAGEFDVVVLVDAPEEVRLARIVEKRGLSVEQARRMIAAQMPATEKRRRATIVIENDATLEALAQRARTVWDSIRMRAEECA
jgi:dephospho-CoA kinase